MTRAVIAVLALCACAVAPRDEPARAGVDPPSRRGESGPPISEAAAPAQVADRPLALSDIGIFSDLDARVRLAATPATEPGAASAVVDPDDAVVILYVGDWPVKAYPLVPRAGPLASGAPLAELPLREADRAELAAVLGAARPRFLARGETPPPGDRDGDGIPDPLDLLIGAHKTALNADEYGAGYIRLPYPGGDVPRERGVCTDVVVRSARNAGLDLQREVAEDIRRAPRAYPMVERANPNIDHRRVKTLLPYFLRHWERRTAALDDASDPLRPGDILFMDTFPARRGPDHIGVVSDRVGPDGRPLVINNWSWGSRTDHLPLLGWVPVTHRFRFPAPAR
jgi:uncharacterized protein YijF (DUF1287 family)